MFRIKTNKNNEVIDIKELEKINICKVCGKQFDLKVQTNAGLNNSGFNELYKGFILAYRLPDMDASKQIFYGSRISVMTLFCSCLESIITNKLIAEKDLEDMMSAIKENIERRKRGEL